MRKRRTFFVGNCQTAALGHFYRNTLSDAREEQVSYVDDLGLDAEQLRRALDGADTIVALERDFDYGLSELQDQPGIRFFGVPMVLAGFVWPYATEPHVHNVPERPISDGPFPQQRSDSFLNRLIAKGVSPEDALEQYLALDIARVAHVDRFREIYLDQQRTRDERTGFEVASFVDDNIATQALFMSPHHPNRPVFNHVARQLFDKMGLPSAAIETGLSTVDAFPYSREELPIHPGIAKHYGLAYAPPERRYRFNDEGWCTFAEFVLKFMRYDDNPQLRRGIWMSGHDVQGALDHLEPGLAASPASARGWSARGYCCEHLGRWEEALRSYRHATEHEPEVIDYSCGVVRALLALGRVDEARALAETIVESSPSHSLARRTLAEALLRAGEAGAGAAQAAEAVRLMPGRVPFWHFSAIAHTQAGDLLAAEQAGLAAMGMEPDEIGHANVVAEIYEAQGRRPEALALLDAYVARELFNDQTFSLIGNFHLRNHDYAEAEAAFARGTELFGDRRPDLAQCLADVRNHRAKQKADA